jgi:hypothetical protein
LHLADANIRREKWLILQHALEMVEFTSLQTWKFFPKMKTERIKFAIHPCNTCAGNIGSYSKGSEKKTMTVFKILREVGRLLELILLLELYILLLHSLPFVLGFVTCVLGFVTFVLGFVTFVLGPVTSFLGFVSLPLGLCNCL